MSWERHHKRNFPWRRTRDPYKILVTEMLLRKTTASQVKSVYDDFFRRFPNVNQLASAGIEEIRDAISHLGMEHKRALLLSDAARYLMNNTTGKVPDSLSELRAVPGVGPYTANAVLCFGFGKSLPIIDTNVIRLVSRYFGFHSAKSRPRTDKTLWSGVGRIVPLHRATEFNWALLDFPALICTARRPKCRTCLLRNDCHAYQKIFSRLNN